MIATPVLKTTMSGKLTNARNSSSRQVKFDLSIDKINVVQFLQEEDSSQAAKQNLILREIYSKDPDVVILQKWISEFKDHIIFFSGKETDPIALGLLKLEWWTKDKSFVSTYTEFILNLLTARSRLLDAALMSFINIFLRVSENSETHTEADFWSLQHVHLLAKRITELIPMSETYFYTLLIQKFPYIKTSSNVLLHYVENLLTVCSYLPKRRPQILECIIGKLIQLDVLCSKDAVEEYEFQKQEGEAMELDQNPVDEKMDSMAFPLAHSLDILLNCLLTFIKRTCFIPGEETLDWEATKKLYKELLTVFDKIILPTRGCCHVQYILFYICGLKSDMSVGFLDYLWKKVQNPSISPVLRQIASFYIGSFVSRANYINISTVTGCLQLMCNWIHRYIDAHTTQEPEVHGTFHSVCQTVFYVFAFRNKELLEMKDGYKIIRNLNFDRIATCRLNPLRFCDATIIQNFASVTRNHQIAYVYPVLEKNSRNFLYKVCQPSTAESLAGAIIPTFFPFDPFFLKRSKHWIESEFRTYSHSKKEEESADHPDEVDISISNELFNYSSSPGFKKSVMSRRTS